MTDTTAELPKPPAPVQAEAPSRWDWLKNPIKAIFSGDDRPKQEGPIPGVTPAQPEELKDSLIKSPNDPNPLTGAA